MTKHVISESSISKMQHNMNYTSDYFYTDY